MRSNGRRAISTQGEAEADDKSFCPCLFPKWEEHIHTINNITPASFSKVHFISYNTMK